MGKHLTFEQLCQRAALYDLGLTQAAIAAQIGSSQPAFSRELKRNGYGYDYRCQQAHGRGVARRSTADSTPNK